MNDEMQQPAPEQQPALPAPVQAGGDTVKGGVIERLPADVQKDIQEYFKSHNGPLTHKYVIEKYGEQYPHLKTIARKTIYNYAKKYHLKTLREVVLNTEITKASPEYDRFVTTALDPNADLADKRAALLDLIAFYKRVAIKLEATQTNFTDVMVWSVILKIKAQQLNTIDAVTKYDKEVLQVKQKDITEEADDIINLCTVALEGAYKMTHKDQSNWANFLATYATGLKESFNNYRHVQEVTKDNPVKVN